MGAVTQIETPGVRPPRTFGAMAGALVFLLLVVLGWVGFRALTSDHEATPVRTVEWQPWVKAGRADQLLMLFAPDQLPQDWRATSVQYAGGDGAHWHLGLLTDAGKYVGIEESRESTEDLARQYVDQDAVRGGDVTVAGETWQSWTDRGGDYALVRSVDVGGRPYESVLVGGSAPAAAIKDFAATLRSGTVRAG
jgi:hypothetical protein